jgi:UDP-2-acetamido-2,6-beta-L-arabino-hexul-4-ose reductase
MLKVGITGARGFLGWHFRCFLHSKGIRNPVTADSEEFASEDGFLRFVSEVDVIVHFAGVARGSEDAVARGNLDVAQSLKSALEKSGRTPHVIYASSIQINNNSAYGRSKREAGEILEGWASKSKSKFTNLVLPNLFGEGGRPFYNSVVATFCHQITRNEKPSILKDAEISFLHAQSVCDLIWSAIENGASGNLAPDGTHIKVSSLLAKLKEFHGLYFETGTIPDVRDAFNRSLFNTYRSFLFQVKPTFPTKKHVDPRGSLSEIVKTVNGGQGFFSTTVPGVTRGDHYHRSKIERFAVISGEATIKIRKLFSNDVQEFQVTGDTPTWIDMPTLHTHNIANTGRSDLYTLFWSDEIFDPSNPDTYAEKVVLT